MASTTDFCSAPGSRYGEVAGVDPGGQRGDRHIELELTLPLVEAGGGVLARGIGVERENDPAGEPPQQPKCSSVSAVPHVATARGTPAAAKPITSV